MPSSDIAIVFQWWSVLVLIGLAALPLTIRLFGSWFDRGYGLSKAVGLAIVTYAMYAGGTLHILPFTNISMYVVLLALFVIGVLISNHKEILHTKYQILNKWRVIGIWACEEAVFFFVLLLWAFVKGHEPSIRGLEKFMDFGFMQSIITNQYFPVPDMWYAGGTINYYYFGHIVTAVVTKLSGVDLSITFNLMLATICAFTFTMSASIGIELQKRIHDPVKIITWQVISRFIFGGVLTGFLVTFAGNMQTIYAFTKGYVGEHVVPFWTILWPAGEFFTRVGEGMAKYWYANATRFIPFTIHEFPSYSFVVSDVHGHVLSIPFVLLTIALLVTIFGGEPMKKIFSSKTVFFGFLAGILLMTNALDGPIYFGVCAILLFFAVKRSNHESFLSALIHSVPPLLFIGIVVIATALPFLMHFDSFASGIGVNCPPAFLAQSKIGPFLFEGIEKCQASPLWMMWLLWGFFWFCGVWLFITSVWQKEEKDHPVSLLLKILFLFSIGLIIFPEFLYIKDIYPAHFRSNTMFKLGYQAFIMWSIIAGFIITHFIFSKTGIQMRRILRIVFFILLVPQLFLVSIYPIFSVRSYFGELRTYKELGGLFWFEKEYPDNYAVAQWMKANRPNDVPWVILEADGDSYTDYNHMSAFTGNPTVVGWAVHEWLWRGGYDKVAPRREDVRLMYEGMNKTVLLSLVRKYGVTHIFVGRLEREKYKNLNEELIQSVGEEIFVSGSSVLYKVLPLSQ